MPVAIRATRSHVCVACGKPIRPGNLITLVAEPPAMWRHLRKPMCQHAEP